jgi:hypothetical protein
VMLAVGRMRMQLVVEYGWQRGTSECSVL